MSVWLVIPVRSLREGKSRLAAALAPAERNGLLEWLLVRTLEQAAQFPGLDRTLVVSPCEHAQAFARSRGAHVLMESAPGGLNHAVRQAQLAVRTAGASSMLMVSCDLPLVQADDLRCLTEAGAKNAIALAPDRAREGTNGVCLASGLNFSFSFGPGSFERHREQIARINLGAACVARDGLAFDLDLPSDLAELVQHSKHAVELPRAVLETARAPFTV